MKEDGEDHAHGIPHQPFLEQDKFYQPQQAKEPDTYEEDENETKPHKNMGHSQRAHQAG